MKSTVTKANDYCIFCGNTATQEHHLIFGSYGRSFAEKYGLKIPICAECHTASDYLFYRIHDNVKAEALSKMLGQAIWEKNYYMDMCKLKNDEARERFIELYGQSFM